MANMINTNIASLNAQNNLNKSQGALTTSLQRLSSGLRINSAKDDAAGMAITTRMSAQISGMTQASRNANDAISMSQTAEGAMGQVGDILQRMRDLSVQSANGSNSTTDRDTIQNEVDQLTSEIDRISDTTEFNGNKLLNGSSSNNSFQVGANANQTIDFKIAEVSTKSLSLNGTTAGSGDLTSGRIGTETTQPATALSINGTTIEFASTDNSASELAAAINLNTDATGVTASAYNVVKGADNATGVLDNTTDFLTISVQQADGTAVTGVKIAASKNMDELVANINKQVGGVTASVDSNGALTLSNANGAAISVTASTVAASTASGMNAGTTSVVVSQGFLSLTGQSGSQIKLSGDNLENFGFNASVGGGQVAGTETVSTMTATVAAATTALNASATGDNLAITTDKVKINGVELNQDAFTTAFTAGEKAQAINAISEQTGVTATASTTAFVDMSNSSTTQSSTYVINGTSYATGATSAASQTATLQGLIHTAFLAGTSGGVDATVDEKSGKLQLTSSTGQDITISGDGKTATSGTITISSAANSTATTLNAATASSSAVSVRGSISLSSDGGTPIKLESASSTGLAKLGLVAQGGSGDAVLGGKLDVTTQAGAQDAIERIDSAISFIATQRSTMGAVQNRFSTAISNLASSSENITAARSRIQDADFATETANLTRGQILQQAGTAMLAQANSLPNGVMALLR